MNRKTHKKKTHSLFLTIIIILVLINLIGNRHIQGKEYTVSSPKISQEFDGFRIVQLSDLHGAEFGKANKRLYSAVERSDPDIIVITGDMIDSSTDISYAEEVTEHLADIAPVYFVTGNHEWTVGENGSWSSEKPDALEEIFSENGVHFLRGSYESIARGSGEIIIAGIDDPNGYADLGTTAGLLYDIRANETDVFSVLLYHRNDVLPKIAGSVDFILSGHAHGGLIRLPFVGGVLGPGQEFFPDYTGGSYSLDGTDLIVSRGLGNHTKIPRIFNSPSIPVIVLRSE